MSKATKFFNRDTGAMQWYSNGSFVTDPVVIAEIEAACEMECEKLPESTKNLWVVTLGESGIIGKRWLANAAEHGPTGNQFTDCKTHINGDPDEEVLITNNWNLLDTDFPATPGFGVSQELYYAWVVFPKPTILRDTNGNHGEWLSVYMGACGQKPQKVAEYGSTNGQKTNLGEFTQHPAGVYQIVLQASDFSAFGGFNIQESQDGGVTFTALPIARTSATLPEINCQCVTVCDGVITNSEGNEIVFDPELMSWCPIECDDVTAPENLLDYEYAAVDGCDNVDGDPANYVNVTRETLFVNGVGTTKFFTNYGDDDLQAEHTFAGDFVDCATGQAIGDPEPPPLDCEDWELAEMYRLITPGEKGVNEEVWSFGQSAPVGGTVGQTALDYFNGPVDYSGMPSYLSAPDIQRVQPRFIGLDDNGQDLTRAWGYLVLTEPARLGAYSGTAEATAIFIGECCSDPELLTNIVYPAAAYDMGVLPAGIHYIGFANYDFSAWSRFGFRQAPTLTDTTDVSTWPIVSQNLFTEKPRFAKCWVKYCPETNIAADMETGLPLIVGKDVFGCEPDLCGSTPADPNTALLQALLDKPQCELITLYEVEKVQGSIEQKWTTSAVDTSTAAGHTYLDAFTLTDAQGYPAHVNPADIVDQINVGEFTTNVLDDGVITDDQAISDFWLCIPRGITLYEANPTAEAVGVWSGACGESNMKEVLNAPYLNQGSNLIGDYAAGFYRFRLYHHDITANGIARLRYENAAGTLSNIPTEWIAQRRPVVTPIYAWCCDDGKLWSKDKSEELFLSDSLIDQDPRCAGSGDCLTC